MKCKYHEKGVRPTRVFALVAFRYGTTFVAFNEQNLVDIYKYQDHR